MADPVILPLVSVPLTSQYFPNQIAIEAPISYFSLPFQRKTGVECGPVVLFGPCRRAGVTQNVIAPRSFRSEVSAMEDRARVVSSQQSAPQPATHHAHREGRGAWVLTAYGISGLALFGVLAYFFSDFIAH
jgi:hypothetical protein